MKIVIILFYIIASIVGGRKNPLFYLIFPLALLQGPGAFIQQDLISIGGLQPLNSNTNAFNDVILVLFIGIALLAKGRAMMFRTRGSVLFLAYFIFIVIVLTISIFSNASFNDALLVGRFFLFIPIYYFLWTRILSSATKENFVQFLTFICAVNVVSSVLYILNSGHFVEIFPKESIYLEVSLGSQYFYRDFATIPILASFIFPLSIIMFIRNQYIVPKYIVIANLILMPAVVLYTFTRGWLLSLFIITILSIFSSFFLSQLSALRKVLTPLLIGVGIIISVQGLRLVFPAEMEYFLNRFESMQYEGLEEGNVRVRKEYTTVAYQILEEEKSELFGVGFNKNFYQTMGEVGAWSADSMWPTHILHTGVAGVIFIAFIMLFFILDSWFQFMRTQEMLHQLCFVVFTSYFALSFSSPILNGNSLVMLAFALFTIERLNYWKSENRFYEEQDYWLEEDESIGHHIPL